jgi:hypothetical protein
MHSSDNNSTSIGNALFHATVQLTVPTVTSTGLIETKLRSYSASEESLSIRKTRYNLSSLSISFPKHSHLNKRKIGRDVTSQSSPVQSVTHKTSHHSKHFKTKMTITSPSKDYLPATRCHQYSRSASCSSTKPNKSIKNTLRGIWQGLNNDEKKSSGTLSINPKHVEEPMKKVKSIIINKKIFLFGFFFRLHQDGEPFPKLLHRC